jgi:hypothetical protein
VATKTVLNAKNLEALGPERLAELLIEITADNPAAKRRLRMELARAQSPAEVAKEVRKRLTIIARSRSFVDGTAPDPWPMTSILSAMRSSRRSPSWIRRKPSICSGGLWRWLLRSSSGAMTAMEP